MLDPYSSYRIHYTDQNLVVNDDFIKDQSREISNDELIRRFKHFLRDYQSGNIYTYR